MSRGCERYVGSLKGIWRNKRRKTAAKCKKSVIIKRLIIICNEILKKPEPI
ncbi:unnamed protein product [Moneuplotes crassus]|uniref:Uncharacterized protein n=1 Tax=Euplotes crassus TaxID=5936 RepID=A0AAD1Y183_EUPCR|nr:unnamed protein product [Moneuplotes crassus]